MSEMLSAPTDKGIERSIPFRVFLQISSQAGADSFQVPAIIRSYSGALVTLELEKHWFKVDPETLIGAEAGLVLTATGSQRSFNFKGPVVWNRLTSGGKGKLSLALNVENQEQAALEVLNNLIPQTTTDKIILRERQDHDNKNQAIAYRREKIHSALLGLALGVITFRLVEPKSFNILSDIFLFLISLLGIIKIISFLRGKKASR